MPGLWEELGGRRLSVINAEAFIASTDDQELTEMHHLSADKEI